MATIIGGGDGITLRDAELTGSMGCLVWLNKTLMVLTSGHVLSRAGEFNIGEGVCANDGQETPFARLAKIRVPDPLNTSQVYRVDAALAEVTDRSAVTSRIGDWGSPKQQVAAVAQGQKVFMWGASTDDKGGRISQIGWSGDLEYGAGVVTFAGLVRWDRPSADGDSGAIVVDTHMRVVGLHVAGDGTSSYFCPIAELLKQWPGMTVVASDAEF